MTRTQPLVVGHRGAAHLAPENTLSSFRRALADGADLLECDVHLSSDGQVIVMHDETIDRTANEDSPLRTGAIADLTGEQLGRVRLQHDEHVPTLAQLLDLTTVPLFIEVKVPEAARAVGELLAELEEGSPQAASTVISFHAEALAEIRRTSPETTVSYLVKAVDEQALSTAEELGAAAIGPAIDGLSLAAARAAREAGLAVHPWTVNTEEQLAVALACEVDSITTDDPGWVKERLAGRPTGL
ncbi:glycerophosphodiester phosphodiesterase [Brachybacterium sp. Marseille-Q2903]|uniref:Glycerophosphodiester phosphodiesterase n=1 Tax=Brachybacterium epidermidis TaxID=2781983 RepID=A0ABR9VYQ6_9MICO|nr:glycerophosphodiester phosphodiesterase family protein [Brachybacterium epidermidis]MBE9403306.1 glycerophosphodiester phosphodiesterase [Brachybacterium epidermidis]